VDVTLFSFGSSTVMLKVTDACGQTRTGTHGLVVDPIRGFQRPGDVNQDAALDLSDGVWLLGHLFVGTPGTGTLPCDGGTAGNPGGAARVLADWNGDGGIDLSDAIGILSFLFTGGKPHVLGAACDPIVNCLNRCAP
jgi:hypothetical protein